MMFVAPGAIDGSSLWQGDIIRGVQILGAINLNSIQFLTPGVGQGDPAGWTLPAKPVIGDAMVLSHSCELDRANGVKVTGIILAPLRDLSTATAPEKIEALISSNLVDQTSPEASFFKYFYLEPNAELTYQTGAVVDFSKCFSVRKQSYEHLLQNKILELTPAVRFSMSLKIALYFHRDQARPAA